MADENSLVWRDVLNTVVDMITAEHFHAELIEMRKEWGDDPDDVGAIATGMFAEWFVESTGWFAALQLPPEQVPAALAEIRETLADLDFDQELERVEQDERIYYDRFATMAAPYFAELGEAMEALFNCYVGGDYDPGDNPNDLITEALETAVDDLPRAHGLITRAGAIALHSHPLWWRWQAEAYGPAGSWLTTIANLVEDYTSGGSEVLGPLEQARADVEAARQETKEMIRAAEAEAREEPEQAAAAPSPVDNLIAELIEQGEARFQPEQLALCQTHREEAIPALIDLATDEYLQMEDSPGEGYAPIHAVKLLGELKAAEAVPALIDIVADTDYMAIIFSAAIYALENIGPPALESLLDFWRYAQDVEAKTALAGAVAKAGLDDERAYKALVRLWDEATWDEGKSLLALPLAQVGEERAILPLEMALEDPELDWMDYNEVASALEHLGVDVPPPESEPPSPFDALADAFDAEKIVRPLLSEVVDPAQLMAFAEVAPEEWRSYPDTMAHAYADIQQSRLNHLIAVDVIILPPELSTRLVATLLQATEELGFDGSTRDSPRWLREAYIHLAECAGPDLQLHITGVLLALQHYLSEDYDIADEPDQLLVAASQLSNEKERRRLFGQAGALTLRGRSFWPLWTGELDHPLCDWLKGLIDFRRSLEQVGQIPLRPSPETDPEELSTMLMEALRVEPKEPSPPVAELVDLLTTQEGDSLTPGQRRRFTHQRATVIPYLIRIVEDKRYWTTDGIGGGWTAILAVRLLGELKAAQATDALVRAVVDSGPEDVIHDAALFSLMHIARPALPAVQAYFRYGRAVETKTSLAEVLGRIGRRRPDSFDLLRQVWESADWTQNRRMVALAFGDLRDRRAVPLLQAALGDRSADALDVEYVLWALLRLGARPSAPAQKRSSRLKTPAPYNPRLLYDELNMPQRLRYTPWGEPLCPDCGKPLVLDEDGEWTHPPEQPTRSPSTRAKRKRKKHRR